MERLHFLNVNDGDCTIIQHDSGRTTIIDVCNGNSSDAHIIQALPDKSTRSDNINGNYNQKSVPVSPISYMSALGISGAFRFILSHPDMDHMDGIERIFKAHTPRNFWDIRNSKTMTFNGDGGRYKESDWNYYLNLRDSADGKKVTRHEFLAGSSSLYYNKDERNGTGDNIYILSPTKELVDIAELTEDYNDCSYVLLYNPSGWKILLCGDSHNNTFKSLIDNYTNEISGIDILIAPHHGRHSDMDFSFLDITTPTITLFGNAGSDNLAYDEWNRRELLHFTNNQFNCFMLDIYEDRLDCYVTNPKFALDFNEDTFFSKEHMSYFIGRLTKNIA